MITMMIVMMAGERKQLLSAVESEGALSSLLHRQRGRGLANAWGPLGDLFLRLKALASGIAAVTLLNAESRESGISRCRKKIFS